MRIIRYTRDMFSDESQYQEMHQKICLFLYDMDCTYPDFERWLDKVFSEIEVSDERIILLCLDDKQEILGLTILKNTNEERKICTIRVSEKHRREKIGTLLLRYSKGVLNDDYPLMTVSERYIETMRPFLKKIGSLFREKVKGIYSKDEYEYFFNCSYRHKNALLSIKPIYANAIMRGDKKVEFRKKSFASSIDRVYVYSSSPEKRIIGSFSVKGVFEGTPEELWQRYSEVGGIEKKDFDEYYAGCGVGYGIEVGEVKRYVNPIDPKTIDNCFVAPQSFCYIDNIEFLNTLNDNE